MFNWTQQTILYLSYSARAALPNTRGINHATPAFNLLRPQLTARRRSNRTPNYSRTFLIFLRANESHNRQEKATQRRHRHGCTVFNNGGNQNNWHYHRRLTNKHKQAKTRITEMQLTPITLSLPALTTVFATAAVLREYQQKTQAVKISA